MKKASGTVEIFIMIFCVFCILGTIAKAIKEVFSYLLFTRPGRYVLLFFIIVGIGIRIFLFSLL